MAGQALQSHAASGVSGSQDQAGSISPGKSTLLSKHHWHSCRAARGTILQTRTQSQMNGNVLANGHAHSELQALTVLLQQ